jgi:RNase P subunit RPR2
MWKPLRGSDDRARDRSRYACTECDNRLVYIVTEPVARKVRSKSASRRRIVAQCPICGHVRRVSLGGPS